MKQILKPIATGKSSFSKLITGNSLYVDKTKHLFKLIAQEGNDYYYFLSRPRRFGKSLTISTLESIFKGEKELFKDTFIYDKYDFLEYPVLHFDMSTVRGNSFDRIKSNLLYLVKSIADSYSVTCRDSEWADDVFFSLINNLSEKYNKNVVVLVDEYDFPLFSTIDTEDFERVRDLLSDFYLVLKTLGSNIKFCFITGITRFPQVSIFSKLNNLVDITDSVEYASLCGYTDEELDYYFKPYIEGHFEKNGIESMEEKKAFREKIKEFYDGYRFSPESPLTVYNPVSVGSFFKVGCYFKNFWISTGSQKIVRDIVKLYPEVFEERNTFTITRSSIQSYELRDILSGCANERYVISYLMQAGYLTISDNKDGIYTVVYPNEEVEETMAAFTFALSGFDVDAEMIRALRREIESGDTEGFIKSYKEFYKTFPYILTIEKERGYQIAFSSSLKTLYGEKVRVEDVTSMGRSDILIALDNAKRIYVIELKRDGSSEDALMQIKERKYYESLMKAGYTIHLLGINFSSKLRNIESWKEEKIML